ncbi:MAG: SDR family oxidoreductase [Polyangiaceae bacterium]|nr:SDR family oxidoreductase [Polyangiaceae bacterium]
MARHVVVTGANRGIGLGLVRLLLSRGDSVTGTARDADAAGELRATGARVLPLDVTSADSVAALSRALGDASVDVLVNNAGVSAGWGGGVEELPLDTCERLFRVNALGPLAVTRALLPHLRRGAGKTVMHVTSMMGSISDNTSGGSYAYRMSKAALNMASRSLAIDLRGERISSFVVHPGWVKTDMGGPGATVEVDECVAGLARLLDGDALARSGRFFHYLGHEAPF